MSRVGLVKRACFRGNRVATYGKYCEVPCFMNSPYFDTSVSSGPPDGFPSLKFQSIKEMLSRPLASCLI